MECLPKFLQISSVRVVSRGRNVIRRITAARSANNENPLGQIRPTVVIFISELWYSNKRHPPLPLLVAKNIVDIAVHLWNSLGKSWKRPVIHKLWNGFDLDECYVQLTGTRNWPSKFSSPLIFWWSSAILGHSRPSSTIATILLKRMGIFKFSSVWSLNRHQRLFCRCSS